MKRGAVYAVGLEPIYYKQACDSVQSLKEQMPFHTTVFTDAPNSWDWSSFNKVERLKLEGLDWMIAKIYALRQAPYDYCVYLDADTFVCHDLTNLFDLVKDRFDIAFTHDSGKPSRYPTEDVPKDFPGYSAGVIAMKRNKTSMNFLDEWERTFHRHKEQYEHLRKAPDRHPAQPSFRLALYHSNIQFVSLPRREYNCPFWSGFVHQKVKVLHLRSSYKKMRRFARIINEHPNSPRVFWHREIIQRGKSFPGYKE